MKSLDCLEGKDLYCISVFVYLPLYFCLSLLAFFFLLPFFGFAGPGCLHCLEGKDLYCILVLVYVSICLFLFAFLFLLFLGFAVPGRL